MTASTWAVGGVATRTSLLRAVAVIGLATAGGIHLLLAPSHLEISPALAFGFTAAGLTQVALAIGLSLHAGRRLLIVAVAASALFLALYAYDITVGLPMGSHQAAHTEPHAHADEESAHAAIAGTADAAALAAKSAEVVTLVTAGTLVVRSRRQRQSAMFASTSTIQS